MEHNHINKHQSSTTRICSALKI